MTEPICKINIHGTKFWYLNRKYHREDGPAVEYADGTKYWYINGLRHRENGPAMEFSNGIKCWYLNGNNITDKVNLFIEEYNLPDYTKWTEQDWFLFKMYI